MCPLSILTVYYFNPTFIIITIQSTLFVESLIKIDSSKKLYIIIFLIIQFIALMIHLELELNFCDLNKNTKRNIEIRGAIDVLADERDSTVGLNQIDLNKDYFIEGYKDVNKIIELEDKTKNIGDELFTE